MAEPSILIIEDEPDLRETLMELLVLSGYRVVGAGNGREGLSKLEELRSSGTACLVLLDLMMPVMDGWQFLKEAAQQYPAPFVSAQVMVLSAAADLTSVQQRYGCRVLKKPLDIEQLLILVRERCDPL